MNIKFKKINEVDLIKTSYEPFYNKKTTEKQISCLATSSEKFNKLKLTPTTIENVKKSYLLNKEDLIIPKKKLKKRFKTESFPLENLNKEEYGYKKNKKQIKAFFLIYKNTKKKNISFFFNRKKII